MNERKAKPSELQTLATQKEQIAHQTTAKRQLGLLTGKLTVPEEFSVESNEINTLFYGRSCESKHSNTRN